MAAAYLLDENGPNPGDVIDLPYITKVAVVSHAGQAENRRGATCDVVDDVDESIVNALIEPGRDLGRFFPIGNNCQTFVGYVLNQARHKPLWMQFRDIIGRGGHGRDL